MPLLLRDKEVARKLGMSDSWVRVQRHKRRKGKDHSFTVDPILIGTTPRYSEEAITEWLNSLGLGGSPCH